jgi:hypothetical protein
MSSFTTTFWPKSGAVRKTARRARKRIEEGD